MVEQVFHLREGEGLDGIVDSHLGLDLAFRQASVRIQQVSVESGRDFHKLAMPGEVLRIPYVVETAHTDTTKAVTPTASAVRAIEIDRRERRRSVIQSSR